MSKGMAARQVPKQVSPIHAPPKYVFLAQRLLRQIAQKRLRPGDFLGTEAELVGRHGVSRVTVRQALLMLEREGYISREKAKGTFIRKAVQGLHDLSLVRGTVILACSNEQADHVDEDQAFATILRAVERHLTERGFASQILGFGADPAADRIRLRELALRDDLEGICTIGPCLEQYRDELPDLPVVTSCTFCPTALPWVGPDSRAACRTCIDHLLAQGHRDIAMFCSSQIDQDAYAIFASAYVSAFEAAGIPSPRHLMYYAYSGEPLTRLATQILTGPMPPTAIFAENWRACQAVLAVANDVKLRIPDDLSLVAFGRNVLQITYPLSVTAYVPDHERIGKEAVEILTALIGGEPHQEQPLSIPGRLVERDSVRRVGPSLIREVVS